MTTSDSDIEKKELPTWLGYTIVFTRIAVTGGATLVVLILGNALFNVPAQVIPTTMNLSMNLDYFAIVAITAVVMTGLMIWPAIAISWGVAWLLSPQIRQDMRDFEPDNTKPSDK